MHADNGTIRLAETSELLTNANIPRTWRGEHHPKQTLDEEAEMDVDASTGAALASGDSPTRRHITPWLNTRPRPRRPRGVEEAEITPTPPSPITWIED
jgi:hypothetical protein